MGCLHREISWITTTDTDLIKAAGRKRKRQDLFTLLYVTCKDKNLAALEGPGGSKMTPLQQTLQCQEGLMILICEFIKWVLGELTASAIGKATSEMTALCLRYASFFPLDRKKYKKKKG